VQKRSVAAAGALLAVVGTIAGCSEPEVRSQAMATVTIDGNEQGKELAVSCNQLQSSYFLNIGDTKTSAAAIVTVAGDDATAETVELRGFGGFTGSYWQGSEYTADASLTNQTFTINGTASGLWSGSKPGTAKFKIVARC
jgi:ipoprotein LpqH